MQHWFGLYVGYCPDEKQPDKLLDGRWRTGAKVMHYRPTEPAA